MPQRKRTARVSDLITDGLCRLIEKGQKPYSEITIQDIVDEAGVCRNSFYRNFSSKEQIFRNKFMEVASEKGQGNEAPVLSISYYNIFRDVAEQMKKHKRFFLCYYKAYARAYFDTIIGRAIDSNTTDAISKVPPAEYYVFACRAWIGVGVLTEWLKRGCDLSVEALVGILSSFEL